MNRAQVSQLGLRMQLWWQRCGRVGVLASLLLAGAAGGAIGLHLLRDDIAQQRAALARTVQSLQGARVPAPKRPPSATQQRLTAFYDALGETGHVEDQIKTMLAIAAKNGLRMQSAEYMAFNDAAGGYVMYQVVFPVKGSYSAIRDFCDQTLQAISFASLDDISFKRDAVASRTVEAKIRLTLYLLEIPTHPPTGAS